MRGGWFIGWRYILFNRGKIALLIGCLTLVLYLPVALRMLVAETGRQLESRAQATPLLVGAKGSPLELTLNSLYFDAKVPKLLTFSETEKIWETGLAEVVPIHVRFRSRGVPIVGTTLDYFEFRGLLVAEGKQMQRLGDCVLGSSTADRLGVGVGGSLISSPETVFDLAGVYPLKMRVAGILSPSGTPDDHAVFVDVKTAWIIEGLAHGHVDLANGENKKGVLKKTGDRITANASVVQFNEVTDENLYSFHFHGAQSFFPLTAIIVVPNNTKSAALLMGRYLVDNTEHQLIVPEKVMSRLLSTVLTVEHYISLGLVLLAFATITVIILVFLLSLKLRGREIETLHRIGGNKGSVFIICAIEVLFTLSGAMVLTGVLVWLTQIFGVEIVRLFL